MRLNQKEIKAICDAFTNTFQPNTFNLYLFGSRTDDAKKGGDIDLLVVTEEKFKSQLVDLKSKIKLKIFESLDDQRIDITVATTTEVKTDSFLKAIFPQAKKII